PFLLQRKHPDRAALGNRRIVARKEVVQRALHAGGIAAPAGVECDVLLSVNRESGWWSEDAGRDGKFPKQLSIFRVERVDLPITRTAGEDQAAARGENGAPVRALLIIVRPRLLARVHVPRLDFTEMIGPRVDRVCRSVSSRCSCEAAAGCVNR